MKKDIDELKHGNNLLEDETNGLKSISIEDKMMVDKLVTAIHDAKSIEPWGGLLNSSQRNGNILDARCISAIHNISVSATTSHL
jgi:hypothetical protein